MGFKRRASPELIPNPFIKKRNLEWELQVPESSPVFEPTIALGVAPQTPGPDVHSSQAASSTSTSAFIEAGEGKVDDHAAHFASSLSQSILTPYPTDSPHLSIPDYKALYESSFGSADGAHFVIHQHDHPVAGTHYDLRLQINETSSASWAIMYGLPGDPNSVRLNRNATETRVHCLWNHLIETASSTTGSLLIWDTGIYTVLERHSKHAPSIDPDSQASSPSASPVSEQAKLAAAFANRKIRLRLHGARLPSTYVLNLRLTKKEDADGRSKAGRTPTRRRRRRGTVQPETSSESESEGEDVPDPQAGGEADGKELSAMEREVRELEDEEVRRTNAYTGAVNSIGSVHQRRWYLSLDRAACGLGLIESRGKGKSGWETNEHGNDGEGGRLIFPFYVKGPDFERSVITGRLSADILQDEGVRDFCKRKGWKPVLN